MGRWLEEWLASTGLRPPEALAIEFEVSAGKLADLPDARSPFLQPQLEIRTGPPQGDVHIRWRSGPARALIGPGASIARVAVGSEALDDRERLADGFLQTVLVFLLRRAGWHHVHAATARDPAGRDWLFAGNAEAGKSTTAALLASRGWAVGGDDATYLVRCGETVEAVAQRRPIALRPGGYSLLGLTAGAAARGGRKMAFFPEELGGSWVGRITPRVLVFPRVEGDRTCAEAIGPREALVELVRWSAWVVLEPLLAQQHLDLLSVLAAQGRSYRLALGPDLFARRDLLTELIAA